jgi:hypothetical protein
VSTGVKNGIKENIYMNHTKGRSHYLPLFVELRVSEHRRKERGYVLVQVERAVACRHSIQFKEACPVSRIKNSGACDEYVKSE